MGTSSNVWTYRSTLSQDPAMIDKLVGYDVEASDGHIGKIDEASTETNRNYLVVDTGFWIFGKKRLIPAGVVTRIDHDSHNVYVTMSKDQIKNAPDFDADARPDDEAYYDKFGGYYGEYGW